MAEVLSKQLDEITARREEFLARQVPSPLATGMIAAQQLAETALLLTLPEPRTSYEAGELLEALRAASLRAFAAAHVVWAQDVMVRVQRRFPDPAHVPSLQPSGAPWTTATWRAFVQDVLGKA